MDATSKKLYRSRNDRYLGGVCGGIAHYFGLDSNLTRLLVVVGTLFWGTGIILYLAALILVPENPEEDPVENNNTLEVNNPIFWGIVFISLGALLFIREMDLIDYIYYDLSWRTIWGLFLIVIGSVLLYLQYKNRDAEPDTSTETGEVDETTSPPTSDIPFNIFRSRSDRKLAGICGGIAEHYKVDPSIVRLCAILLIFASQGLGVLVYAALVFILPEAPPENGNDQSLNPEVS